MKVYRYMCEEELNKFLKGDTSHLGAHFESNDNKPYRYNTHNYKEDTKYIHFFKKESSLAMLQYLYRKIDGRFYFCTFDIPFPICTMTGGKGYYPTFGYDDVNALKEYAVPANWIKPEWLVEYKLDTTRKDITFADAVELTR